MKMKPSKVVPMQQPVSAVVYTATVISSSNKQWVVDLSGANFLATVCFSCLVQPQKDDVVMCVMSEEGDYYITGIIQRPSKQSMTVTFPDDVTLQSPEGSISIMASDSVTVAAANSINCLSGQVLHKSRKAFVDYENLTASGSNAQVSFASIRILSGLISTISRQVVQKFKNYFRHSEENDLIKAGNMTRQVKGLYSMDSEYIIMLSKKDTKIDGERIHMG